METKLFKYYLISIPAGICILAEEVESYTWFNWEGTFWTRVLIPGNGSVLYSTDNLKEFQEKLHKLELNYELTVPS